MQAERTRWFSAMTEPPVNGDDPSEYEWRCTRDIGRTATKVTTQWLMLCACFCDGCQWRGLTARGLKQWAKGAR